MTKAQEARELNIINLIEDLDEAVSECILIADEYSDAHQELQEIASDLNAVSESVETFEADSNVFLDPTESLEECERLSSDYREYIAIGVAAAKNLKKYLKDTKSWNKALNETGLVDTESSVYKSIMKLAASKKK